MIVSCDGRVCHLTLLFSGENFSLAFETSLFTETTSVLAAGKKLMTERASRINLFDGSKALRPEWLMNLLCLEMKTRRRRGREDYSSSSEKGFSESLNNLSPRLVFVSNFRGKSQIELPVTSQPPTSSMTPFHAFDLVNLMFSPENFSKITVFSSKRSDENISRISFRNLIGNLIIAVTCEFAFCCRRVDNDKKRV